MNDYPQFRARSMTIGTIEEESIYGHWRIKVNKAEELNRLLKRAGFSPIRYDDVHPVIVGAQLVY